MTAAGESVKPDARALLAELRGMLPMLLAAIPFSLNMWTLGLIVYFAASAAIFTERLVRRERIPALDWFSVTFLMILAAAYLLARNIFLLQHFGAVINSLLLAQVLYGELRGEPWTLQFSKRMYPQTLWSNTRFIRANRFLSRAWAGVFVICIACAALGRNGWLRSFVPTVLPIAAIALGPRVARRHVRTA